MDDVANLDEFDEFDECDELGNGAEDQFCLCGSSPDIEERAFNRCKSCGKFLY